jgi:molecular chaperone DnaK (HSP70)
MSLVLGIDLGTTYSVVATVNERGVPVVLRNPLGDETTPSVVCFESATSVLVGKTARNAGPVYPDRTVSLIKRQMGSSRPRVFDGVEHTPESISALILRALVDGVAPDRGPGELVPAVITVPAYFGIREREATQAAAQLAGIDVLELVAEPVAAAIHYGFAEDVGIGTALVYDLGGGTFDTTVLILGGRIEVIATDGDVELGGADWDGRLAAHLLAQFVAQAAPTEDPADDDEFMADLMIVAERTKQALSTTVSQRVPLRWRGHNVTVSVTRAEFEAMTADLLERGVEIVRRLLATARAKGVDTIDRCLLVGGSSHMPTVAAVLDERFGWSARLYDPDLAVAKGAALRAHQLLPRSVTGNASQPQGPSPATAMPRTTTADPGPGRAGRDRAGLDEAGRRLAASVASRGLGLLIHDSHDKTGARRYVEHVIHQNDALPASRRITVSTIVDGQQSVHLQLYEQAGAVESGDLDANRMVLDGEIVGLTPQPGGSPLRFTLSVDNDGRVEVVAEDNKGRQMSIEAYIDGVVDRAERDAASANLARLTVRQ